MLTNVEIIFGEFSNLCDHNSPTSETDGQTTCDRNTALCTKVHRAVTTKYAVETCRVPTPKEIQGLRISGKGFLGQSRGHHG